MSDEDEIRALTQELERLTQEAAQPQDVQALSRNNARQQEIRERLAALGRPID